MLEKITFLTLKMASEENSLPELPKPYISLKAHKYVRELAILPLLWASKDMFVLENSNRKLLLGAYCI